MVPGNDPEITLLRRPGDTDKESSGNFNHKLRLFSTFSTNTRFEPEKPYSPAEVFFLLECGNDKKLGVKALLRLGYGKSYQEQRALARSGKTAKKRHH